MEKENLKKEWSKLHVELVNMIVAFCEKHGIEDVSDVYLNADCLFASIKYGEWCPATDSCLTLVRKDPENDYKEEIILSSC